MTDFDYEVKQKKALARSAKHKVNGVRSKKCTLATDYMSPSEIKKMNGEMISYNLNKPMTLDEFKRLPADLGKEYILQLVEQYGGNFRSLSEMFGCNRDTAFKLLSAPPYNIKFGCGDRMNREKKARWLEFLHGDEKKDIPLEIPPEAEEGEALPESVERCDEESASATVSMEMEEFSMRFSGTITAEAVANRLKAMLGDGIDGTISIIFSPDHRKEETYDKQQRQ